MLRTGLVRLAMAAWCGEARRSSTAGGAAVGTLRRMAPRDIGRRVRPFVVAVFVAAVAWLWCGTSVSAATIQVTTSTDEDGTGADCSLREALRAVYFRANFAGCVATGGAYGTDDQITFAASLNGVPILLTNGVLGIFQSVQMTGNGPMHTIIDGQKGTPSATGVIHVHLGASVGVTGVTIRNASANSDGGVYNQGTLTVTNSTLSGNSGSVAGGIFNEGTLTVIDSTLSGNSGSTVGGIFNQGTLTVTNGTLSGNSGSAVSGGIYNQGVATVTNGTFSGNSASIFNQSTLNLRASILETGTSGVNCVGAITSRGSNVANDMSCGLGAAADQQVANGAILLGSLADNGGPTQTHALLEGSPAIDAVQGACTSDGIEGSTVILTDQRGRHRPAGARCDAGAYEYWRDTLNFSAPAYSVGEGDGSVVITVTRSGGPEGSVGATVTTANGTAAAPGDYTATTQTVTFADGDTASKTVSIGIVDDPLKEPNETVVLTLSSPTGGVVIGPQSSVVLTIFDNDPIPSVSITNVTVMEGNSAQSIAAFSATLSNPSNQQITVAYATSNGTATAGSDYTATSDTLTFTPGVTFRRIVVPILGDTLAEPDETFTLTLSDPTNATLGVAQAIVIIQNDDGEAPRALTIAGASVLEGDSGTTTATFTVTRSGSMEQSASVQYATSDGSAKAGTDYTSTTGTLTFGPNESTKTLVVQILGDTLAESDETFMVTISNPTNATLGVSQTVGVIQNDDVAVACGPRPRVTQLLAAGGGALAVHIEASPLNTSSNNPIRSVRFGTFQNATVTLNGQNVTSGQTVTLPPNTVGADFTVRRVTAGQATTVPFTVSDSCGSWDTFVGGGAGAGF